MIKIVSFFADYPDNRQQNDVTTCKTSNQERIISPISALIGLLMVAFIIIFAYFYTRLLVLK